MIEPVIDDFSEQPLTKKVKLVQGVQALQYIY